MSDDGNFEFDKTENVTPPIDQRKPDTCSSKPSTSTTNSRGGTGKPSSQHYGHSNIAQFSNSDEQTEIRPKPQKSSDDDPSFDLPPVSSVLRRQHNTKRKKKW